jgi:hypothetical protein
LKTFEFFVDQIPFGYAYNFDNYLFNKIKHINTQEVEQRADYFIINNVKKRIEGKIHFLIEGHIACSPYKSLFGSFEFSPRIHPNLLLEFWTFIENDLKSRNIEKVKITNFAGCYSPKKADLIEHTMEKAGFSVELKAINHHLPIVENTYEDLLHSMEKRKLKKCLENGFDFQEEPSTSAAEIYDYIQLCRKEQGLKVSISFNKLSEYLEHFSQNYLLFTVRHKGEIAAATIAIKVHRHILYSFLPASLRKFKSFSPSVLLHAGMFTYCQDHQIELLDLGISTERNGKNQDSLIEFKERIGGEMSYKYFFAKKL